jgi:phospholipid/cholesterol/gamma-HCH transport system permease protein
MRSASNLVAGLVGPVVEIGAVGRFLLRMLYRAPPTFKRPALIIRQVYNCGLLSIVIIMLSGLFVGMVLGLQGVQLLARFGAEDAVGAVAAFGLIREIGPVITALLFAGRAGTSLASELGLMRATDQLSAMEMMAVDPIQHVVIPRFLGGVIAMPLLAAIFNVIGLYGVQLVGIQIMAVDRGTFWSQLRGAVRGADIYEGIVKSLVFGVICSLIAVYQGFYATPTAEGVGQATTRTVVTSAITVLLVDYLITAAFL